MSSSSASSSARRSWLFILVLLGVIDIVTVSGLLSRNQRLREISQDVSTFSQQWASRLEKLSALRGLAHEVLADTRGGAADPNSQGTRLGQAVAAYVNWAEVVRRDQSSLAAADREAFETELNAVSQAVSTVATHRLEAIKLRSGRDFERAAAEMAVAERASAPLPERFARMEGTIRTAYSAVLTAQDNSAAGVRNTDLALATLNLMLTVALLVIGTTKLVAPEKAAGTTLLDAEVRSLPGPPAAAATSSAVGAEPPSSNAPEPRAGVDTEGLEDFPSEFDAPSWRRAG